MISMLWMLYQQLSLACSFAAFLILMNFHQLTHLLVWFRVFFHPALYLANCSAVATLKLANMRAGDLQNMCRMKPWCIWYTYSTLRNGSYPTQPWFGHHWSFDGARYDMRRWSWTSKIWHTFCSATWSKWATLKSMEPAMNSNEHDASTNDPRFWGDKQKIQQVRQILGQAKVSWLQTSIKAMQTKVLRLRASH